MDGRNREAQSAPALPYEVPKEKKKKKKKKKKKRPRSNNDKTAHLCLNCYCVGALVQQLGIASVQEWHALSFTIIQQ